ncbi:uncharacterized protein N7506_001495 [Penicillium brevicompactum]|uniref:uncharacterized protein n=1 Tax=Penicillium brevicompactum TaxID=5074 RepID=UPI00254235FC|nr:uncharacterized protein N7506_001495 [Penicillium brevicompactum]KAJ5348242.1 hypothetical protein N7506_001495 [Penicillium brevicompactum]
MLSGVALLLLAVVSAKPVVPRQDTDATPTSTVPSGESDQCTSSTSSQWLSICDTTIFWPTSTDYFYGPTDGPEASVVSCNAEWVEYNERATGLGYLGVTSTSTSYSPYFTSTGACSTEVRLEGRLDPHTGPVTTLCDGVTRALGPRETVTDYWPGTGPCVSSELTWTEVLQLTRTPSSIPSCTLNVQDCIPIWQTYSSLSSAYQASVTSTISGDINSPIEPSACPTPTRDYSDPNVCDNCHYLPGTATFFYWPVATSGGGLCDRNGTTIPATRTGDGPNTAVVDGNTFVSPSVYVSFTAISAYSNQRAHPGGPCGGAHENVIISVDPEAVTSYRNHRNAKYPTIGTAYPFDFSEYQKHQVGEYNMPLIPWDQYIAASQCQLRTDGCSMVRDDYLPWLEVPDVMTQIDPLWTSCHRSWYMPPVSLVPLASDLETQPTATAEASSILPTPATPSSGLAAPTPTPT